MPDILFATSAPSPSTPTDALTLNDMRLRWEGWDGSVWDICDRRSGVFLLAGTRGLGMPTGSRFRDPSPGHHGSQHRGTLWGEREVFWPTKTWHEGKGMAFIERDRAFFRTMDPEKPGRWFAVQPDGQERHLELRYDPKSADDGIETFPTLMGWAQYGVYLTADQPFWVGKPSVKSFEPPRQPEAFYEPNGPHLFNLGQGFTFANAAIDNLGDVESFPRWFIDGEAEPGAWVGVGDLRVTVPFAIPAWKCLVIESDPTKIGATMYDVTAPGKKPSEREIGVDMVNPVNMSRQLGEADFTPVPPGKGVKLSISLEGSGVVEAYLPSLYRRAW